MSEPKSKAKFVSRVYLDKMYICGEDVNEDIREELKFSPPSGPNTDGKSVANVDGFLNFLSFFLS